MDEDKRSGVPMEAGSPKKQISTRWIRRRERPLREIAGDAALPLPIAMR